MITIPDSELEFSFVRSSGPGGQNVNKVNSKAVLRWNLLRSAALSEEQRARILEKIAGRLTREGDLLVASDKFRDQLKNKNDCLEKLYEILARALHQQKKRKNTKPSYSSQKKAQEKKSRHSQKKKLRKVSRSDY